DFLRIEGEIRDTPEARYWMTKKHYAGGQWRECGLCPQFSFPATDLVAGTTVAWDALSILHVNIMLPSHSGFAESWVRFSDPNVKYIPPTVEPGKVCAAADFLR